MKVIIIINFRVNNVMRRREGGSVNLGLGFRVRVRVRIILGLGLGLRLGLV